MKKKLMVTYFLLLLIGSFITGLLSLNFVKNSYLNDVKEKLISNGNLINKTLVTKSDSGDKLNYFALSQYFSNQINARVTFVNINGEVLADSTNNSIIFENYHDKSDIIDSRNSFTGIIKSFDPETNKMVLIISMPVIKYNNLNVITRMSVPLDKINQMNKVFLYNVFLAMIIGTIIAIAIGYYFINSIVKPIKELSNLSNSFSIGNFTNKFEIKTRDEIEELGKNFNNMAEEIEHMINEVKGKNVELNAILSSMISGLLAVDLEYNIMFINPFLKKITNIDDEDLHNKKVKDIFPDDKIESVIKHTLDSMSPSVDEWTKDNKIYKVYTNIITNNEHDKVIGVVILLQDITRIQKLETLRSEFVSNVSHELRTPLTIIQGFVETLTLGAGEEKKQRDRFLKIIDVEVLRLKRLIEDLLMLSEIENYIPANEFDEVDVLYIIKNIQLMFKPMLEEKSLKLFVTCPDNLWINVYSEDWFKQMIINLVDNSIKYTNNGGEIRICAEKREQKLYLSIEDTGKGIPSEDIERVFERFYRVEKGRSRKSGGTGLGLSIVKHIVTILNGDIKVESKINLGTKFNICILLNDN